MKKIISVILISALLASLFVGCSNKPTGTPDGFISNEGNDSVAEDEVASENGSASAEEYFSQKAEDMFSDRDSKTDYDTDDAVSVELNGDSATASSDSVKISGTTVQITQEATYVISGTLADGTIVINANDTDKIQLVFNGVDITAKTSAALYVAQADKVFVTLADGTSNTLANAGSFESVDGNSIDAAVYSKQDLTFNGTGELTVSSPAGHGIVCKDDLVFAGGTYTVNSSSHGIDANDSVQVTNTTLNVDAGKDIIHCENTDDTSKGYIYIANGTIKGEAEGDGLSASAYMQIEDGTFELLVGGGSENGTKASSENYGGYMGGGPGGGRPGKESGKNQSTTSATTEDTVSMKGLKAVKSILISGGNFKINSADDSIHSDESVTVNGGSFLLTSGDDAIHAEEKLTVTNGNIEITESYEGLEALDIVIKGGNINLISSDDGLNAAGGTDSSGTAGGRDGMFGGGPGGMSSGNGSIVISGGKLYINASGDGIDANGTLEITGGYTVVVGPAQGDTATLDYDKSAVISGGTFIGTGASGMAQTFSDCEQGVVSLSVGNQSAGTNIVLKDSDGNVLIEYAPKLNYAVVILSEPSMVSGEAYTVTIGSQTEEFKAS